MAFALAPTAGFITSTTAQVIAEGLDSGTVGIRLLTLYNPNSTATTFTLQLVREDTSDSDEPFVRFRRDIPPTDTWAIGLTGTSLLLLPTGYRYEVVLAAAVTTGIHWVCDMVMT